MFIVIDVYVFVGQKGLAVVAISSNYVTTHPQVQMTLYLQIEQCWSHWMIRPALTYSSQDGPDFMAEDAKIFKYPFPYLYDEVIILLSFVWLNWICYSYAVYFLERNRVFTY